MTAGQLLVKLVQIGFHTHYKGYQLIQAQFYEQTSQRGPSPLATPPRLIQRPSFITKNLWNICSKKDELSLLDT